MSPIIGAGIGAGTKNFAKHPNILRVIVGDLVSQSFEAIQPAVEQVTSAVTGTDTAAWTTRRLWILEANIDDMTGEVAGYLSEKLLAEGSLDVWFSPTLMKKSRPAYTVHVLCEPHDQERLMRLLFVESTTLGVRRRSVERCSLHRQMVTASTGFGDVRVKVYHLGLIELVGFVWASTCVIFTPVRWLFYSIPDCRVDSFASICATVF